MRPRGGYILGMLIIATFRFDAVTLPLTGEMLLCLFCNNKNNTVVQRCFIAVHSHKTNTKSNSKRY